MKLHNTLTRKTEEFKPLKDKQVTLYSCGPTVYDHIHIGNLSAFIMVDTLRRVLQASGYDVKHAMNFTDVDDKTIRRSAERYPDLAPEEALKKLTDEYKQIFLDDMKALGNNVDDITFVNATDSIEDMRELIRKLHKDGFAYIAEDGVYFSIEKYRSSGKKYGQLTEITETSTSAARIHNDEYDKDSVHDFALWKTRKGNEPAWPFELDGHDLLGRPGWHIECSAMSVKHLGQPFDIHTGGVDLIFPHHENEIAQSTAGGDDVYAKYFAHNEHLLVDGKKMSKSLNNFYTLQDVRERGFDPLAFRLFVLQSHYRSQSNFTWKNLEAAQNRLNGLRAWADLRHQPSIGDMPRELDDFLGETLEAVREQAANDMNIPEALAALARQINYMVDRPIPNQNDRNTGSAPTFIDSIFGLNLDDRPDISPEQKAMLADRQKARDNKNWSKSDELRDKLKEQGLEVRDASYGSQIWSRI